MEHKIVFPPSANKYVELQCNDNYGKFADCPELQPFMAFICNTRPANVLDIGCGLGRNSVYLFKELNWSTTTFHLLDGDSGEMQYGGCYEAVSKEHCYNSMAATKEFCTVNGITEKHLRLLNVQDTQIPIEENSIDIAYSIKAIGWHWPINKYLDWVYEFMQNGALLFFEIRHNFYPPDNRQRVPRHWSQKQVEAVDSNKYKVLLCSYMPDNSFVIFRVIK